MSQLSSFGPNTVSDSYVILLIFRTTGEEEEEVIPSLSKTIFMIILSY